MRVGIRHVRIADGHPEVRGSLLWLKERGLRPATKGGVTLAYAKDDDGSLIAVAEAICRPDENFNRRLGRAVAEGRLRKMMEA